MNFFSNGIGAKISASYPMYPDKSAVRSTSFRMKEWISYARFERIIAWFLLLGMAIVIVLASINFGRSLFETVMDVETGWDYTTFQSLFDRVIAVLIALELAHSVQQTAAGKHGLIQVRTVVLIGVLAVVRKFILLEIETTSGLFLAGLAAAILALGLVYALILWVESSAARTPPDSPGHVENDNERGTGKG